MQAIDYWLRVRHHQELGDFPRYGYFPGLNISSQPPLLFVVAPSLQFHPAGDVLARYLVRDIEICRLGLNENWRRGLRVVLRQTLPDLSKKNGSSLGLSRSCFPGCVLEVVLTTSMHS